MAIVRQQVVSSNVIEMGYDPKLEILEVAFKGGTVYQYTKVPLPVFEGMQQAASIGQYLNQNVKGKFDYKQVE